MVDFGINPGCADEGLARDSCPRNRITELIVDEVNPQHQLSASAFFQDFQTSHGQRVDGAKHVVAFSCGLL